MKEVIIISGIIMLATLISCNKKELEENNQFIIGTWEANFESISGCDDAGLDTQGEITCSEVNCIRYTFEEGGVYISNTTTDGETFGEQGTFSLDIDNISLCIENDGNVTCTGGAYDVNAATLSFTIKDPDTGCSVFRVFDKVDPNA